MDMAERNGSDLRRRLCSAERRKERATALGSRSVNTPGSNDSALLVCVTLCDHLARAGGGFRLFTPAPERRAGPRSTMLAEAAHRAVPALRRRAGFARRRVPAPARRRSGECALRYSYKAAALLRRVSFEPNSRVTVPAPRCARSSATPPGLASSSAKYLLRNSSRLAGSWPYQRRRSLEGATDLAQNSIRAPALERPRGQRRSTRMRRPSAGAGWS